MKSSDTTFYLKYFLASLFFLIWVTLQGVLQGIPAIHEFIELPPARIIVGAHVHVGMLGWISMSLIGLMYMTVSSIGKKPIAYQKLTSSIFYLLVIGIVLMNSAMIISGIQEGMMYVPEIDHEVVEHKEGILSLIIALGGIMVFLGSLLFSVQMYTTLVGMKVKKPFFGFFERIFK